MGIPLLAATLLVYSAFWGNSRVTVIDAAFLHRPSQSTFPRLSANSAAKHVLNVKCVAGARNNFLDLELGPFESWPNPRPHFGLVLIYHPLPVDEGPLELPDFKNFEDYFLEPPNYRAVTYVGLEHAVYIMHRCPMGPRSRLLLGPSAKAPTLQELQARLKSSYKKSTVRFLIHAEYRAEVGDAVYEFETLAPQA